VVLDGSRAQRAEERICGTDELRRGRGALLIGSESREGRGLIREVVRNDGGAIQWRRLRIKEEKWRGRSPVFS
jgi:hypothetical protein